MWISNAYIILWLTHVIILYTKHDFAVWSYMDGPNNNSIYIIFPLMHGPLNPTYVFYFCFMMKEHPHIFHFIFLNKYIFHFTMRKNCCLILRDSAQLLNTFDIIFLLFCGIIAWDSFFVAYTLNIYIYIYIYI